MGFRRKGREFALQALYLSEITKMPIEKALRHLIHGQSIENKIVQFAEELTQGITVNIKDIDETIIKHAKNWELNRMAALDRNILRLGTFEILHQLETPISVVIDEAVEIAKTFSTEDSGKFVNGILDQIKRTRLEPLKIKNGHE
jgi:transcription antitermination factor NusB